MKTKKLLTICAAVLFCGNVLAVNHGSMKVTGTPLYEQRNGAAPGAVKTGTFDFKMVTVGDKTWALTNLTGNSVTGDAWASQLRWWQPAKEENNLTGRIAGTQQTYGTNRVPASTNPVTVTYFQNLGNGGFAETGDFTYNKTLPNSKDNADNAAPVLADPVIVNQTALLLNLTLSASDNSGDFFYYIEDAANNFREVSFFNEVALTLTPGVAYTFSVYAIDFSGNESTAKTVQTQVLEPTYITAGTAKAISFKLDSRSLTELKIDVTSNDLIGDAFVKLELNGNAIDGEWKPVIGAAGTHSYQIVVPASAVPNWAANAVLSLNLGYIIMPIGDWGHYVVENKVITAGANNGSPIFHKIGTGVDIGIPNPDPEYACENNLLSNVALSLGQVYFAPGWNANNNYTANIANGEITLHFTDATYEQWQAQFPFLLAAPLAMNTTKNYGIVMNVETSNNLPFYVKFMDTDDNAFLEIAKTTISAPSAVAKAFNLTASAALTQISKILFDFGGNAANTSIKISDITICDQIGTSGVENQEMANAISVYQSDNRIVINTENEIVSASLFNLNGQRLPTVLNVNTIATNGLAAGMYILQIRDIAGNNVACKVVIK